MKFEDIYRQLFKGLGQLVLFFSGNDSCTAITIYQAIVIFHSSKKIESKETKYHTKREMSEGISFWVICSRVISSSFKWPKEPVYQKAY